MVRPALGFQQSQSSIQDFHHNEQAGTGVSLHQLPLVPELIWRTKDGK